MNAPRIALCLEQTLGHRAHTLNLEAEASRRAPRATVVKVDYPEAQRIPMPWAVRGSAQAINRLRTAGRADATLFHTSTIALGALAHRKPYVVSVDATPLQLDTMGAWYRHARMPQLLETAKRAWYSRVFRSARRMVAWSRWSADSLVADYGVDRSRIVVAHPGASRRFFEVERAREHRVPTILFVGGDFERKGGSDLLEAFRTLNGRAKLALVTTADVPTLDGVEVLSGVTPGSDRLLAAYANADIFCLPTKGDCTSVAIEEAMAAGLPVVTTPVGSNPDTVRDGETGVLVPAGDPTTLAETLRRLVDDPGLRQRLGLAGRDLARDEYDAEANARRVLDTVEAAA